MLYALDDVLYFKMKILHEFYFYGVYKVYAKIFGLRWAHIKSTNLIRITDVMAIFHLALIFLIIRKITPKISFIEIIVWTMVILLEFFYADKNLWGDKYLNVIAKIDLMRTNKTYWPFMIIYSIAPILFSFYLFLPKHR